MNLSCNALKRETLVKWFVVFLLLRVGTDVGGKIVSGVIFNRRRGAIPGARLEVVHSMDTFTPAGFEGVQSAHTNKLFPTSGANVLSPGGIELGPGPNPSVENDGLELDFESPVAAVGFDLVFQSLDCCSYTSITVFGSRGEVLYSNLFLPSSEGGGGEPGGSIFLGFVSTSRSIARIVIDESDADSDYPDSNIG